ncbi:TPA: hypothetical protein U2B98_001530 [Streptococcus suis]|nr:hypothetical protein [Streptococcus suis]HEM6089355.1 hypothetical protein [Streptococcus suis]HEM6112565.1 hypothetical protein [Streptococcus suis]HEM6320408.1 hypothetical protein [Streptococcus suis]HEM6371588.1 hypothetical protein [Streptococcus suis]
MLVDKESFFLAEEVLRKQGILDKFEAENGKITGYMMITMMDFPPELKIENSNENVRAFYASFDFYDMMIGIAIDLSSKEPVSQLWLAPQCDDAVEPSMEWIEFFLKTLFENLSEDGVGIPMYSFVNDHSDFTAVPHKS